MLIIVSQHIIKINILKGERDLKTFKAMQLTSDFDEYELEKFIRYFSNKHEAIVETGNRYVCIPFNPDIYILNQENIFKYFVQNKFVPLVLSNFKFLSLLLEIDENKKIIFKDFSFKMSDEEAYIEKNEVEDLLLKNHNLKSANLYLKESNHTIKNIELQVANSNNRLIIHSSGNISISNRFEEIYYCEILKIIQFLFTSEGLS